MTPNSPCARGPALNFAVLPFADPIGPHAQVACSLTSLRLFISVAATASCHPHSHIAIPMRRLLLFAVVSGNTNSQRRSALLFRPAAISPRDLVKWYLQFEPVKVARLVETVRSNRSYSRGTVEVLDRQCRPLRPFP